MWVAKIKIVHKECITSQRTKKHNVTNLVYGLSYYEDKEYYYFSVLHVPRGEEKNKKAFIKDVKSDPRILKFEQSGNIFFTLTKEPKKNKHLLQFYNPKLIYIKPDVNTPTGHEIYELASWDKKPLQEFIKMTKEHMQGQVLKLKEEKIASVFIPHISTQLTTKQLDAISLANNHGYYNYPRRINQEQLAQIMKLSKSTYQNHLRTAEKKLMPFLIGHAQMFQGTGQ